MPSHPHGHRLQGRPSHGQNLQRVPRELGCRSWFPAQVPVLTASVLALLDDSAQSTWPGEGSGRPPRGVPRASQHLEGAEAGGALSGLSTPAAVEGCGQRAARAVPPPGLARTCLRAVYPRNLILVFSCATETRSWPGRPCWSAVLGLEAYRAAGHSSGLLCLRLTRLLSLLTRGSGVPALSLNGVASSEQASRKAGERAGGLEGPCCGISLPAHPPVKGPVQAGRTRGRDPRAPPWSRQVELSAQGVRLQRLHGGRDVQGR